MIKEGYTFRVKYVNRGYKRDGNPYLNFSIGDKVTNGEAYKWQNYTVWDSGVDQGLVDGDEITITKINSVSTSEYKGKLRHSLDLEYTISDGTFTAPQEQPYNAPREQGFSIPQEEDSVQLPFDI